MVKITLYSKKCLIDPVFLDTYSVANLELTFERLLASTLIGVYAPTAILVMLSWLSFWISLDAIGARTTLVVTVFLALVQQFSAIRKNLPVVSYVSVSMTSCFNRILTFFRLALKALDIWMLVCMIYVFGALVEYTIVKMVAESKEDIEEEQFEFEDAVPRLPSALSYHTPTPSPPETPAKVSNHSKYCSNRSILRTSNGQEQMASNLVMESTPSILSLRSRTTLSNMTFNGQSLPRSRNIVYYDDYLRKWLDRQRSALEYYDQDLEQVVYNRPNRNKSTTNTIKSTPTTMSTISEPATYLSPITPKLWTLTKKLLNDLNVDHWRSRLYHSGSLNQVAPSPPPIFSSDSANLTISSVTSEPPTSWSSKLRPNRQAWRHQSSGIIQKPIENSLMLSDDNPSLLVMQPLDTNRNHERIHPVERWSRILFPLTFVFFNVIYWSMTLTQAF